MAFTAWSPQCNIVCFSNVSPPFVMMGLTANGLQVLVFTVLQVPKPSTHILQNLIIRSTLFNFSQEL